MLKFTLKHPSLEYAQDIAAICGPLTKLNISYFAHVHIDKNGQFSALGKNPEFVTHYLNNQYYNFDIHMAKTDTLGEFIIWDMMERRGKSEELYQESVAHGVNHTFTLIEKNTHGSNYYHFANADKSNAINQTYVSNLDLLKLFISYFKDHVRKSKVLRSAYDVKFSIDENTEGHLLDAPSTTSNRLAFLKKLNLKEVMSPHLKKPLSSREIEILIWMHHGKTANEIASIIGRAEVTVNKHITNIKAKTGCYTPFQLGEFFSTLFPNVDDIINSFFK